MASRLPTCEVASCPKVYMPMMSGQAMLKWSEMQKPPLVLLTEGAVLEHR